MKRWKMMLILPVFLFVATTQAADLKVSETTIDYGTIKEGPSVIRTINLTNAGTQKLTIANVTTS